MENVDKGEKIAIWASYVLQGIIALFLSVGAISNILKTEEALSHSRSLGYAEGTLIPLALFLIAGVLLYVIPRTCAVGAIFLTAWFGGATATHIIHGDGVGIVLSPVAFGLMVWIAIWLRNQNVRTIFSTKG